MEDIKWKILKQQILEVFSVSSDLLTGCLQLYAGCSCCWQVSKYSFIDLLNLRWYTLVPWNYSTHYFDVSYTNAWAKAKAKDTWTSRVKSILNVSDTRRSASHWHSLPGQKKRIAMEISNPIHLWQYVATCSTSICDGIFYQPNYFKRLLNLCGEKFLL